MLIENSRGKTYSTGQGKNDVPHYGLKEHAVVDRALCNRIF
jgi:hypothetical protein